jgi:hypothetical protein
LWARSVGSDLISEHLKLYQSAAGQLLLRYPFFYSYIMVVTTRTNTAPGFHAMPAASYSGWDTQNRCLARQAVTRTGAADFLLFRLRVDRDPAQRFVRMLFFSHSYGCKQPPGRRTESRRRRKKSRDFWGRVLGWRGGGRRPAGFFIDRVTQQPHDETKSRGSFPVL